MNGDLDRLARALGHRFERRELLIQALTHRSAGAQNNERLEFLGDALLGCVIAEELWRRFREADEGRLSRLRAFLVKEESLANLARELELGSCLRLGPGELRSGGHARNSILSDGLEALFAAVYLDAGFDKAKTTILSVFEEALERVAEAGPAKDPKTRLQELLQAQKRPLPEYRVLDVRGSQHAQIFHVRCALTDGSEVAEGQGTSRRRAEQQAAQQVLHRLEG